MIEQLIKPETSKLAREIGWKQDDCRCVGFYCTCDEIKTTQSLLQKWLRENYNINICIIYWDIDHIAYTYLVDATFSKYNIEVDDDTEYKSYEDALEEGLMIVLKLIK